MRERLTYANVMATIGVFLALGGASYAAIKLPKDSVGAKQLKKNAVTTAKIKNRAVTAAKIKNGALTGAKIDVSTLGAVPSAANATNADNADRLDGLDSSDYLQEVTGGSFAWDPPSLEQGICDPKTVVVNNLQPSDVAVATPRVVTYYLHAIQVTTLAYPPDEVIFLACNHGTATLDQPEFQLSWRLLR